MGAVPCLRARAVLRTFAPLAASFPYSTAISALTLGNVGASVAPNLLQNPMQWNLKVYSEKTNSKIDSEQIYLRRIY